MRGKQRRSRKERRDGQRRAPSDARLDGVTERDERGERRDCEQRALSDAGRPLRQTEPIDRDEQRAGQRERPRRRARAQRAPQRGRIGDQKVVLVQNIATNGTSADHAANRANTFAQCAAQEATQRPARALPRRLRSAARYAASRRNRTRSRPGPTGSSRIARPQRERPRPRHRQRANSSRRRRRPRRR